MSLVIRWWNKGGDDDATGIVLTVMLLEWFVVMMTVFPLQPPDDMMPLDIMKWLPVLMSEGRWWRYFVLTSWNIKCMCSSSVEEGMYEETY